MSKGKNTDKKKKTGKRYSEIKAHTRLKKTLVPPFLTIPGLHLSSWINDRLPEMLWSSLLISQLGRNRALDVFRRTAQLVAKLPKAKRVVYPHALVSAIRL